MHNLFFKPVPCAQRRGPTEYAQGLGWFQPDLNGTLKKRRVRKPYYHLIWPRDGNRSKMSRLKDILRGEGPDMHITIGAEKDDYMHIRQRKSQWARHRNLDDSAPDYSLKTKLPGTKINPCEAYDFRTRKYVHRHRDMWTDALRMPNPRETLGYPYALRDIYGEWKQLDPHWLDHEFGGLPDWNWNGRWQGLG